MLVSLMTRLNAINQMHNAQYSMMQNRANMMNLCRALPPFLGSNQVSLKALNELDKQFAMNNIMNETLYMIASAQEKSAAKMMAQEFKNSNNTISYIA